MWVTVAHMAHRPSLQTQLITSRIAYLAQQQRRSERGIAEAAKISPSTMQRRMAGISPFNTDELAAIAGVLDTSVLDLVTYRDQPEDAKAA